jgi:ornithine cyclodeaminase
LHAELGEIVVGRLPGRERDEERIVLDYVGLAIEDVAEAYRLYRRATEMGLGRTLPLWNTPLWT